MKREPVTVPLKRTGSPLQYIPNWNNLRKVETWNLMDGAEHKKTWNLMDGAEHRTGRLGT